MSYPPAGRPTHNRANAQCLWILNNIDPSKLISYREHLEMETRQTRQHHLPDQPSLQQQLPSLLPPPTIPLPSLPPLPLRRNDRTHQLLHPPSQSLKRPEIDPSIPIHSVLRLVPPDSEAYRIPRRSDPIPPTPAIFKKKTRQLRKLRNGQVWRNGSRDDQVQQMQQWFPSIPTSKVVSKSPEATGKTLFPRLSDLDMPPSVCGDFGECPESEIGLFEKLPGELRNRIYRMAVIESGSVKCEMKPGTCSEGTCRHSKVGYNVPGIANTCRRMRWEVMPIYCLENEAFQFDDGMTQQCCVGIFLNTLGEYADLIPEYRFELKRPWWDGDAFSKYATYTFTLVTPDHSSTKRFELVQSEEECRKVCQCSLEQAVDEINARKEIEATGQLVKNFLGSDAFEDFVWRMRKSKQWIVHLAKCKKCGEVVFNN